MNNINDLSLEELIDIEYLSVRSINVCKDAGLVSLTLILDFYEKHGSFKKIRNCGAKSDKELIELCGKYKDQVVINGNNQPDNDGGNILETINSLTPFQKATLNRHFEYLQSKLEIRSYNGLTSLSQTNNPKEIFEKMFSERFSFRNIRNIGSKSVIELEKLYRELIRFISVLQTIQNDQLSKEYAKLIIKTTFKNLPEDFEEQFEKVFDENKKIKLFNLLKLLIYSGQLFTDIQKGIFEFLYTIENSNTLDKIATDLGYTRERARQIKSKLEENIQNYFLFVSNFIVEDLVSYDIDPSKDFQIIDKTYTNQINEKEDVNFNTVFYSIIFSVFLKRSHSILGDNEVIFGKRKTVNKKKFRNCYLINTRLINCFDFEMFVEDVYLKINERIPETYSLKFQGYIYDFFKDQGRMFFDEIQAICEVIIFSEFDIVLNPDGYISFERNTKKQVHEYFYEVLDEVSEPMTIEQIMDALSNKFPDFNTSIDAIRGSINNDKELFMYFGRSSTYGLRKWERERDNIKGGTIRDIVEEYLQNEDSPKHISEILEFVLKYRPDTNEKSVLSNIKVEESNKFCFYSGDFVGLQSKTYSPESVNFKRLIGSHFHLNRFNKMKGWDIEDIVKYFIEKYGYKTVQIRFLIQKKIDDGGLKFTQENKLTI